MPFLRRWESGSKSCELGYQKLGFFRHSLIGEFIDRMGNLWVPGSLSPPVPYRRSLSPLEPGRQHLGVIQVSISDPNGGQAATADPIAQCVPGYPEEVHHLHRGEKGFPLPELINQIHVFTLLLGQALHLALKVNTVDAS